MVRGFRNGDIAFGVVVLAALVLYFSNSGFSYPLEQMLLVVGLVILYLGAGILGAHYVGQHRSGSAIAAYFIVLIPLGTLITYLGKGNTWLVLLPMVGSAVDYFRRPWVYLMITLIWLGMSVPFYFLYGIENALGWGVPFLAAVVFVAVFTQVAVSEQQARLELAKANQKLREYAAQVEELTMIRERNRLAREIHDGLGHYLTAINIQIKAAQAVAQQDPTLAVNALENAQSLSQEALADVRRSVSALRADPTSGRPVADTLKSLLEEAFRSGVETSFAVEGDPRPLTEQIEFTLFRVAQEGLTNVRKHAQARRVDLRLVYLEQAVRVVLQDDGVGANQTEGGFGLVGLKERVELVGGSLHVETTPGKGFMLQAELPAG